jgi:hypothetical protein
VTRELRDVAAAAAESYSVVYAFDLNRRVVDMGREAVGNDQGKEIASRLEPLGSLASETNGALIIDAASYLDRALNQLGDANTDYYIVGFAPPADALHARETYRHVSVRVTRKGATVSTRTGYATLPAVTAADRRRTIDAALVAPYGQQGLRVEYTTYVSRSETRGMERVAVSLDAQLPVAIPGTNDAADVVFVVRDSHTGQVTASGTDQVALPSAAAPGASMGLGAWRVQFTLPPGDYMMRCVVREPGGLLGSADRQFSVRALSGPAVAASDLFLGVPGAVLPVRARAYTSRSLGGAVRVYGRSADQLARLAGHIELVPSDPGGSDGPRAPVIGAAGVLGPTRDAEGGGVERDVLFDVPLEHVAAGEYVAHVILRRDSEPVGDLRRQVDVLAGAPPPEPLPSASANTASRLTNPHDVLKGVVAERLVNAASRSGNSAIRRAADALGTSRWNDALAALVDIPPSTLEAVPARGLALIGLQRYDEAARVLGAAFMTGPDDAALDFVLGWARLGASDAVGAVSAFRNAALVDPSMVPAHLALADTYLRLNQPALAAQALEAGLRKRPDAIELKRMLETIKR